MVFSISCFLMCPDMSKLPWPWNNHTGTVLIKSLLGPLVLASYWLTPTSLLTHFYLYIITRSWPTQKVSAHLPRAMDPWHPSNSVLPPRIQFCLLCLSKFYPIRPRQFLYSLASTSNTQRGLPHQLSAIAIIKIFLQPVWKSEQRKRNLLLDADLEMLSTLQS